MFGADMSTKSLAGRPWPYVSILKGRSAEYAALTGLDPVARSNVIPLVALREGSESSQAARDLAATLDVMRMSWEQQGPIILDGERLTSVVEFSNCVDVARQKGWLAIPATRLGDSASYHEVVRSKAVDGVGVTLRLGREDVSEITALGDRLTAFVRSMALEPSDVDVLIDLRAVEWLQLGSSTLAVANVLRSFPSIDRWRHLVVAATGSPASLREFGVNEITEMPRTESILYGALVADQANLPRLPTFADYAVAHPDPVEDVSGPVLNMAASIRYSTDDGVLIVKGYAIKDNGYVLFPDLLRQLVAHPQFAGADFSRGDRWIREASEGEVGPGNATTWREAATNHHITVITRQFASPSAA